MTSFRFKEIKNENNYFSNICCSVPRCFEMEIGTLNVSEDKGVPLEHLISCVKGVGIVSVAGHKRLQWAGKNEQAQDTGGLR